MRRLSGPASQNASWLRHIAALAIVFGVSSTAYKAFIMRFTLPIVEANVPAALNWQFPELSHKAYIAHEGYAALDAAIPHDAVIQFNPASTNPWWTSPDYSRGTSPDCYGERPPWCGSELGGDPAGCPAIIAAVHSLYSDASARRPAPFAASTACSISSHMSMTRHGRIPQSWVWTLPQVVAQPKFRALNCRP